MFTNRFHQIIFGHLLMVPFLFSFNSNAQNTFPASGNVGIGTISPNSLLHVNGNVRLEGDLSLQKSLDNADRIINAYTDYHTFFINGNNGTSSGPSIEMYGRNNAITDRRGAIRLVSYGTTGEGTAFVNYDPAVPTWRRTMTVTNDNKVYIGDDYTNTPGNYKLYVESGILTEKIKVAVKGTTYWSDFVFHPDYKLMSLKELQQYISQNKHLPEIPNAEEVVAEGVDVG